MALINTTRSSARFVLELLDDIKAHILAEPKYADMSNFCELTVDGYPSCQTTGCFAGWAIMLAGLNTRKVKMMSFIGQTAEELLGTDLKYTFGRGNNLHFFNNGVGDSILSHRPGTLPYAKAMARRIDRFIRLNGGRRKLATHELNPTILARYR